MMMWRWTRDGYSFSPGSGWAHPIQYFLLANSIGGSRLISLMTNWGLVVLFVHRPSLGHSPVVVVAHFMLHIYRSLSPPWGTVEPSFVSNSTGHPQLNWIGKERRKGLSVESLRGYANNHGQRVCVSPPLKTWLIIWWLAFLHSLETIKH